MIRKQNILSIVLLSGSLATGGCVSTDEENMEEPTPISFGSAITRAAVEPDKTGMENFLVWGGVDGLNNLFDGVAVSPQGHYAGTRYWVPGKLHRFDAVHPHGLADVSCAETGVIVVKGFDTSLNRGSAAIDLMTASVAGLGYNEGETPNPVPLTFSHRLSRVKFVIATDANVTITDVRLWGLAYKGDFTTRPDAASVWSNLTHGSQNDTPFQEPEQILLEKGHTFDLLGGELLLIPQSVTDPVTFSMTWTYAENGMSRTVTVPLSQAGLARWEQGKSYQYTATIPLPATDITLKVDVLDWNDQRVDADL